MTCGTTEDVRKARANQFHLFVPVEPDPMVHPDNIPGHNVFRVRVHSATTSWNAAHLLNALADTHALVSGAECTHHDPTVVVIIFVVHCHRRLFLLSRYPQSLLILFYRYKLRARERPCRVFKFNIPSVNPHVEHQVSYPSNCDSKHGGSQS